MAAVNRSISASLTHPYHAVLSATSGITEPVFAPEDSQEAAEEAFLLDVTERLVAGVHPIKVFRDYRGMTQAELARQVGLSPMYISQIETGRRGGSTKALRRIAAALDIDLADLVQ
ncbi:MAG: helix-turn-helix domain-containing protein [Proteobacteria bacterium]|nr:helix-turn-helix domain-containing protein [Pseudomonadota bacterium]MCH8810096.1 helix-turn-helix domain-containing protein [Pseudomonadota bacterium]